MKYLGLLLTVGLAGLPLGCTGGSILALNTATGEAGHYDDLDDVPDDMEVCDDQAGCPELVDCEHLDTASCDVRSDCESVAMGEGLTACVEAYPLCDVEACGAPLSAEVVACSNGGASGPTGRCVQDDGICEWEVAECHDSCSMDNDDNHDDCDDDHDSSTTECVDDDHGGDHDSMDHSSSTHR